MGKGLRFNSRMWNRPNQAVNRTASGGRPSAPAGTAG